MSTTYQDDPASLTATLPGTYCPFTDVIVPDPYRDIVDGLRLAFYRPLRVPVGAHPPEGSPARRADGRRAGSMIAWMSARCRHAGAGCDWVPFTFKGELARVTVILDRPKLTPAGDNRNREYERARRSPFGTG